jgi:hypothetical protein
VLARIRSRVTYANVMATIAVFLALGGGAYAAFSLPRNSVGAKQLKKHAVTPSKVAKRTVKLFKGQKGDQGPAGPGAKSFATTLNQGTTGATIANVSNGLRVTASCTNGPANVALRIETTSGLNNIQVSGTGSTNSTVFPEDANGFGSVNTSGTTSADFDVVARDSTAGQFERLDLHGEFGVPCTFWGTITPSS